MWVHCFRSRTVRPPTPPSCPLVAIATCWSCTFIHIVFSRGRAEQTKSHIQEVWIQIRCSQSAICQPSCVMTHTDTCRLWKWRLILGFHMTEWGDDVKQLNVKKLFRPQTDADFLWISLVFLIFTFCCLKSLENQTDESVHSKFDLNNRTKVLSAERTRTKPEISLRNLIRWSSCCS